MTALNAAVIGLGVGEGHIKGYSSHPGCRVVALCDTDPAKLVSMREKYPGIRLEPEANTLLDDPSIDVVSIATYDDVHTDQIVRAIEHGKHVFAEKPLCLHRHELQRIRRTLRAHPGVHLSSNLILRRSPRFRWLKEQVRAGALGELLTVEGEYRYGRLHKLTHDWRGMIDYYSIMLGGGVHVVDLLMWLTSDRVVEVGAFGCRRGTVGTAFRHNDTVQGILRFASGMVGRVACNFAAMHPHFHAVNVFGTKASFLNEWPHGKWIASSDRTMAPISVESEYPGVQKGDLVASFVDQILGLGEAEVQVDDVFATMSVCLALDEAAAAGTILPVTYE